MLELHLLFAAFLALVTFKSAKMVENINFSSGVIVFDDLDTCNAKLCEEMMQYPYKIIVLGLDCEWVTSGRQEDAPVSPVALLQLAFPNGTCFLIRLCKMQARLPEKLKDILEDRNVLKTGVGISEDVKKLNTCYGLVMQGYVDLRHVALRCRAYVKYCFDEDGNKEGMSLSALSQQILGVLMDKDWRIRCSNWEASELSKRQIKYAANDAIVAVQIFFKLAASKLNEQESRIEAGNITDDKYKIANGILRNRNGPLSKDLKQACSQSMPLESDKNSIVEHFEVSVHCKNAGAGRARTGDMFEKEKDFEQRAISSDNPCMSDSVKSDSSHIFNNATREDKLHVEDVAIVANSNSNDTGGMMLANSENIDINVKGCVSQFTSNEFKPNSSLGKYSCKKSNENEVSESCSEEQGILSTLVSTIKNLSMGSVLEKSSTQQSQPKFKHKTKNYTQYEAFKTLELNKKLFSSQKFWSCITSLCHGITDVPYKVKSKNKQAASKEKSKQDVAMQTTSKVSGLKPRRNPLYQNCVIEAPDGEMLCTCDKRKADWYLCRNLGKIVKDEPYTIRLNFEPSGRPFDPENNYYLTFKENVCVVCGRDDSYMRKNIIPHDYRKHFPICMKDHHSHDVLLLCPSCHMISTYHDDLLRKHLAEKYQAPLGNTASAQVARLIQDPELKKVKSAAKALLHAGEKIPENRRNVLAATVKEFFKTENITTEMLTEASEFETRRENCDFVSHGREVVRKVKKERKLLAFERMWREHFLETMRPKYLPPLWTVNHEQEKVKRLLEEELKLEEYKEALD